MKLIKLAAAAATGSAMLLATACGGSACSDEELAEKAQQLSEKIQEVAQTNPEKLAEFSERAQELSGMADGDASRKEVCQAYDALLAELD